MEETQTTQCHFQSSLMLQNNSDCLCGFRSNRPVDVFSHLVRCPKNISQSKEFLKLFKKKGNQTSEYKILNGELEDIKTVINRLTQCLTSLYLFNKATQKNIKVSQFFQPGFLDKFITFHDSMEDWDDPPEFEEEKSQRKKPKEESDDEPNECFKCQSADCKWIKCGNCKICKECLFLEIKECNCGKEIDKEFAFARLFEEKGDPRPQREEKPKAKSQPEKTKKEMKEEPIFKVENQIGFQERNPRRNSFEFNVGGYRNPNGCIRCNETKKESSMAVLECQKCRCCHECFYELKKCRCERTIDKAKEVKKFKCLQSFTEELRPKLIEEHYCFKQAEKVQMTCTHCICEACLLGSSKKSKTEIICSLCGSKNELSKLISKFQAQKQEKLPPNLKEVNGNSLLKDFRVDASVLMNILEKGQPKSQEMKKSCHAKAHVQKANCQTITHSKCDSKVCAECTKLGNLEAKILDYVCPVCSFPFDNSELKELFGPGIFFSMCCSCKRQVDTRNQEAWVRMSKCEHFLCRPNCMSEETVDQMMKMYKEFTCPFCDQQGSREDLIQIIGMKRYIEKYKDVVSPPVLFCEAPLHPKKTEKFKKSELFTGPCGHNVCMNCLYNLVDVLSSFQMIESSP